MQAIVARVVLGRRGEWPGEELGGKAAVPVDMEDEKLELRSRRVKLPSNIDA